MFWLNQQFPAWFLMVFLQSVLLPHTNYILQITKLLQFMKLLLHNQKKKLPDAAPHNGA